MSRLMRVIVMFDLPVKQRRERAAAARFRKFLLDDGFYMLQYSVYARPCNGYDGAAAHIARVRERVPPRGSVRCLTITERQYARIEWMAGAPSPQELAADPAPLQVL